MATLLIRIQDLDPDDAGALETLLRDQPGVFGAVVSVTEGCAEVDFEDDEADLDGIVGAVREAGWDARVSG